MTNQTEILSTIKSLVKEVIPDAKIYLFGSRATGKVHEESDWDILILTEKIADRALRKKIHYKLFPFNLTINGIIDTTIVNENDWIESPSYYILNHSIKGEQIAL